MNFKKTLTAVAATGIIASLAITASATTTLNLTGGKGYELVHLAGDSADAPIRTDLIKKAKFTFSYAADSCLDEEGKKCENGECVGVAYNSDGTSWKEVKFCIADKQVIDVDLAAAGYPKMKGDEAADYLQVGAAAWGMEAAGNGTCKVELFAEDGSVLATGQQELASATTASTTADTSGTTGTGTTATTKAGDSAKGGAAPKTGVAGVAALGGVAIIATGAVIATRKRK